MFIDKDGGRIACFGYGSISVARTEVYPGQNGSQVEVHLLDASAAPGSIGDDCSAEIAKTQPCKVILGFNSVRSIQVLIDSLEEARNALAHRLLGV